MPFPRRMGLSHTARERYDPELQGPSNAGKRYVKQLAPMLSMHRADELNKPGQALDKRQRLAEALAGHPFRGVKKAMSAIDKPYRLDQAISARLKTHPLTSVLREGGRATRFERFILAEAMHADQEAKLLRERKGSDLPPLGANPYSTGFDFRMGRATPLGLLAPILREHMRYATTETIEEAVQRLSRRFATAGDLVDALESDDRGVKTGALLDAHGDVWVHLELLCRLVVQQELQRCEISRRNRSGRLTPDFAMQRVYSLEGCYRLSRDASIAAPPGYSAAFSDDPGSHGAYQWYQSDFGTDKERLARERDGMQIAQHAGMRENLQRFQSANADRTFLGNGGVYFGRRRFPQIRKA